MVFKIRKTIRNDKENDKGNDKKNLISGGNIKLLVISSSFKVAALSVTTKQLI